MTHAEKLVWSIVSKHKGSKQAITSLTIQIVTGLSDYQVRFAIKQLTEKYGKFIASYSIGKPKGFFIIATYRQWQENDANLASRQKGIGKRRTSLKNTMLKNLGVKD